MKKSLIALAAVALSGAAMAQSSVTLYGVADVGVGKAKIDGDTKVNMISANTMNNGNSRLGVRGVEDLGGGLKVAFNFETGLDLEDGSQTNAAFWARQANISIGGDWGTFKMGRQFTASYLTTATYELTGTANYSALANTYNYAGLGARADSAFAYVSPNMGGLTAAVAFVSKNDIGADVWDLGLMYNNGPIAAGLSVNKIKGDKTNYQLGGKYNFGNFAVAASYNKADRAGFRNRGFSVGGSANMGAFALALDLTRDTKNDAGGKKYTNGVLEGKYALSKRTFVYAAYLRYDGDNNYGIGLRHNF